jgi:TPR repeat protein
LPFRFTEQRNVRIPIAAIVLVLSGVFALPATGATHKAGDVETAVKEWRELADAGDVDAAYQLARVYLLGQGVAPDLAVARHWMRQAALGGHELAADCLAIGHGMGKKGRNRLRKAARRGDVVAQYFLADRLAALWPEGKREALQSYRSAAEGGVVAARLELARRYLTADGVDEDPHEAVHWLHLAADQSAHEAYVMLGDLYLVQGELQEPERSAQWFHKAADEGDTYAQLVLALMYAEGRGVPRDPVQAYAWLTSAAEGTLPPGYKLILRVLRRMVASELTEEQIAGAEALSRRRR